LSIAHGQTVVVVVAAAAVVADEVVVSAGHNIAGNIKDSQSDGGLRSPKIV